MSFVATWTTAAPAGDRTDDELAVRTASDVAELIKALNQPGAGAALLCHQRRKTVPDDNGGQVPDHNMTAGVWQGFGYLSYADLDHEYMTLAGVENSPAYPAQAVEYDAGTGVALELLSSALVQFLETAQRPTCVTWREPL
jgi:hypothetical protein